MCGDTSEYLGCLKVRGGSHHQVGVPRHGACEKHQVKGGVGARGRGVCGTEISVHFPLLFNTKTELLERSAWWK